MAIGISVIQIVVSISCCLAALVGVPLFFHFRWPAVVMWCLKLYVSALTPIFESIGVLTVIVGLTTGSIFMSVIGIVTSLIFLIHIICITRPPIISGSFEQAFGPDLERIIRSKNKIHFLPRRTAPRLPAVPRPRPQQNISFANIPGTNRKLLCDIWQPPENINPSGVGIIYLHGSAFYFLDKDFHTRPLFSHLAAQGHVIMDVAYRLAPETDLMGMIHDVKRAIVWMKENAKNYGIDPTRILVSGGSAGGYLALMAAYTCGNVKFTAPELVGKDDGVRGVVSLYGPTDLEALYFHTNQHLTTRSIPGSPKKKVPTKMPASIIKSIGEDYHRLGLDKAFENVGTLAPLLGGHPDECPDRYALLSPVTHVHSNCPPTLLIHGAHDIMAPVTTTRLLYTRLAQQKIPTVLNILPQTDHGFDLILPKISLSAHNAYYDVERFIAIVAMKEKMLGNKVSAGHKEIAAIGVEL